MVNIERMIKKVVKVTNTHVDLSNKLFNQHSDERVYFLGIRIWKHVHVLTEVVPDSNTKIGFK
jgi:hypothetical protein